MAAVTVILFTNTSSVDNAVTGYDSYIILVLARSALSKFVTLTYTVPPVDFNAPWQKLLDFQQ